MVTKQKSPVNTILAVYLVHVKSDKSQWFLDSGASAHICHTRRSFFEYSKHEEGNYVLLGDDSGLAIAGVCDIPITLQNGEVRILKHVLHVPQMRKNLMSVRRICSDWMAEVNFDEEGCYLKEKLSGHVLAHGSPVAELYQLDCRSVVGRAREQVNLAHDPVSESETEAMLCVFQRFM